MSLQSWIPFMWSSAMSRVVRTRRLLPLLIALAVGTLRCEAQCLEWDDRFFTRGVDHSSSFSDNVYALAVFDDGSGPALYVGGGFAFADWMPAGGIARWNGTSWSTLGTGVGGTVNALAVFDDGSGPALYAGGGFTNYGGPGVAPFIARWNGSSWSDVGGGMDNSVHALAVFDDGSGPKLYAGGSFQQAGVVPALRIAQWNGSSWSQLDNGMNSDVYALAVFDDGVRPALYVGGVFTMAGGTPASHIAKWDGVSPWSAVGSGIGGLVFAFSTFDDGSGSALYVGGTFTAAGGVNANRVAKWDGRTYSALGDGCDATVNALHPFDDGSGSVLVAGGSFLTAETEFVGRVAQWDGAEWESLDHEGMAIHGNVRTIASFDDGSGPALYAGGEFLNAGDVRADYVARWDGSGWSALESGVGGVSAPAVRSLVTHDDGSGPALYVAGRFTSAGAANANNVARWDGASWSALGSGISGGATTVVHAQAVYDDGTGAALFVTGKFTTAGGAGAAHIAKWNGTTWSALGTGLAGGGVTEGHALAVFDDGAGPELFVAGSFTLAGGVMVNRIAKWNGTSFSAAGGFNAAVYALAVHDDGSGPALYAGGSFTQASGMSANRIAKRVGPSSWAALGTEMDGNVFALLSFDQGSGPVLFAGGSFTSVDFDRMEHVARWNGTAWSTLGTGTDNWVYALAGFDDGADGAPDLYVGGGFVTAGSMPSTGIAQWHGCPPGVGYCFGDGLDPVVTAACPCSNFGDPGRGCANSNAALGGAHLFASGSTNPNTVLLTCTNIVNNTLCTFLRGKNHDPQAAVFGDGIKCLNSPLFRFGQQHSGQIGNPLFTVSVGAPTEIPGFTWYYTVQYRNPTPGFCNPGLFNASNGYTISW